MRGGSRSKSRDESGVMVFGAASEPAYGFAARLVFEAGTFARGGVRLGAEVGGSASHCDDASSSARANRFAIPLDRGGGTRRPRESTTAAVKTTPPGEGALRWNSCVFVIAPASGGRRTSDMASISARTRCWRGDLRRRALASDDSYRPAVRVVITCSPTTPRVACFTPSPSSSSARVNRRAIVRSTRSHLKRPRSLLPRSRPIPSFRPA